jgi:hypothetical protein
MPPIKNTISLLAECIIAETHASIISRHPTSTLKRLYLRTPIVSTIPIPLVQFPALSGPCTDLLKHPDINHSDFIDLDATCFMMFTRDLPTLFGIMARTANRKLSVKDLPEFYD